MELPVSLPGAVLGGRIQVPTVTGRVTMTIPKSSDTGTQLRLRGKGIHKKRRGSETSGDQGFPTGTGVSMAVSLFGSGTDAENKSRNNHRHDGIGTRLPPTSSIQKRVRAPLQ